MTLYESIFERRSVRNFRKEDIGQEILEGMVALYHEMAPLFPGIKTSIEIVEDRDRKAKGKFGGVRNVSAPYYLAVYSEEKEKADMNAGYIMQQISLYLFSKGVGSCFQGMARCRKESEEGLHFVMLMAFGYPKTELSGKENGAKRLSIEELCAYKEKPKRCISALLDAARLAPSAMNSQPWRFVVYENRIHVFSKRLVMGQRILGRLNEFNFGIMMANIMVTAEQLWIDVDCIKLNNITHISLPNNQYVISLIIRE